MLQRTTRKLLRINQMDNFKEFKNKEINEARPDKAELKLIQKESDDLDATYFKKIKVKSFPIQKTKYGLNIEVRGEGNLPNIKFYTSHGIKAMEMSCSSGKVDSKKDLSKHIKILQDIEKNWDNIEDYKQQRDKIEAKKYR